MYSVCKICACTMCYAPVARMVVVLHFQTEHAVRFKLDVDSHKQLVSAKCRCVDLTMLYAKCDDYVAS